jgi:drug/metabolite transporter (DMT)-like permease
LATQPLITGAADNPVRGIVLKLVSILLFTVMSALIKAAREVVPPGETVFFRSFFAIPPILIYALAMGRVTDIVDIRSPRAHVVRGIIGVGAMGSGFTALGLLPLPEAIAINYAAPLIATGLAAVMLGEVVRVFRWTAVGIGLFGVLIMLWPRLTVVTSGQLSDTEVMGVGFALLGAGLSAMATIQIRTLTQSERTLAIVFWFAVSASLAGLLTLPWGWVMPDRLTLVLLVSAGLLGGTAQMLMTESYRFANASTLAPFEYSSMVYGIAIGYLIFAEIPGWSVLVGGTVVIGAGLFIIWRERQLNIDRTREKAVKSPKN